MGSEYSYSVLSGKTHPGNPNSRGRVVSKMAVTVITDYYWAGIYGSSSDSYQYQDFIEYPNGGTFQISNNSGGSDIEVCVVDNYYNVCPASIVSIIDENDNVVPLSKVYFEAPRTPCDTYAYRSGSIIESQVNFPNPSPMYQRGMLCRLSLGDFKQFSEKEPRCCMASNIDLSLISNRDPLNQQYSKFVNLVVAGASAASCPVAFSNGFASDHCNTVMDTYCSTNSNTKICLMYFLSKIIGRKSNLDTIINYCSANLNESVCMYLSIAGKENGNSAFSDLILKNYCEANPQNPNCGCYNTSKTLPTNFKNNSYIGPITCWYKPCAELTKPQFLLTEQSLQRSKCNLVSCTINVGEITAQANLIELINNCRSTSRDTSVSKSLTGFFDDDIWSTGNLGILTISLLGVAVLLSTCILSLRGIRNK